MNFKRGLNQEGSAPVFIVDCISESRAWSRPGMQGIESVAPLYIDNQIGVVYERGGKPEKAPEFVSEHMIPNGLSFSNTASINYISPLFVLTDKYGRRANFDETKLKELFSDVEQPTENSHKVYPEDIMDYIYASLHSPDYREKYKEFLKTDFPRVPRPKNWKEFWRLVELGRELRELHLMHKVPKSKVTFPIEGDNTVDKLRYEDGKVYINKTQYFDHVSELAWNFYIGGYQPAQKWLKDRKGRTLKYDDINHYESIIAILERTDELMRQIG